jgi:Protein of unknown function (DUF3017)
VSGAAGSSARGPRRARATPAAAGSAVAGPPAAAAGPPAAAAGPAATPAAAAPARRRGAAAGRGARGPRAKPPRAAQLPYLLVLVIAIGALAWMWQGGIQRAREGTLALAGAMFIGALARLVLPEARAGMLASRRRLVDVMCLAALAIGLLAAGLVLPVPS